MWPCGGLWIIILFNLQSKKEDIGHPLSLNTGLYCLHLPFDTASVITRDDFEKVDIGSPWDVGYRLVEIFDKKLKQPELAKELKLFIDKRSQNVKIWKLV